MAKGKRTAYRKTFLNLLNFLSFKWHLSRLIYVFFVKQIRLFIRIYFRSKNNRLKLVNTSETFLVIQNSKFFFRGDYRVMVFLQFLLIGFNSDLVDPSSSFCPYKYILHNRYSTVLVSVQLEANYSEEDRILLKGEGRRGSGRSSSSCSGRGPPRREEHQARTPDGKEALSICKTHEYYDTTKIDRTN